MNSKQFALIGGAAAIGLLALFRIRLFRRWLSIIWEGDIEDYTLQQELKKIDIIKKCAKSCSSTLQSLKQQLTQLETELREEEDVGNASSTKASNPGPNEGPAHAAAASSYYHFDSSGKKLKSKWDSYNVDDELKRLDGDDVVGEKKARIMRELRKIHAELWEQQDCIDSIRGNELVCSQRKVAVKMIKVNMDIMEELKQRADVLP